MSIARVTNVPRTSNRVRYMNLFRTIPTIASAILLLSDQAIAHAATTPGFNQPTPQSIMTPNEVETSIGTLRFFEG